LIDNTGQQNKNRTGIIHVNCCNDRGLCRLISSVIPAVMML